MKIAIIGGGGVGGYLAAMLSKVSEVDLISKSLKKLFIKHNGKIEEYFPNILKTPPKNKIYDVVIFTVKSYVLDDYINLIKENIDKNTIILPLLNGIEPYKKLKTAFPDSKVIKGAIYIVSNKISEDTVELKGKGALIVFEEIDEKTKKLKEIFEKAGIKVKITKNIDKAIWQKYLFIAATAALTSYYKKNFGQIAKEHLNEYEKLLDEILKIAKKEGVHLTEEDKIKSIDLLKKSPPNSKTSMQLDFEKNRPNEMENILGYLVKLAEKQDIEIPILRKIYKKLKLQ